MSVNRVNFINMYPICQSQTVIPNDEVEESKSTDKAWKGTENKKEPVLLNWSELNPELSTL